MIGTLIDRLGNYYDILRNRKTKEIQVGSLTESDRADIVRIVLQDYNKKLTPAQSAILLGT